MQLQIPRPWAGPGALIFMSMNWLQDFLPLMRCPDTHQSLRLATASDLQQHGLPTDQQALARQDGTRLFPMDQGIPILLPEEKP